VAVVNRVVTENLGNDIIISADTIVSLGDHILEKPDSKAHAMEMLAQLSGREHSVFTAVTIAVRRELLPLALEGYDADERSSSDYRFKTFLTRTAVQFAVLSPVTVQGYVDSEEPMDKAGSYGIQGIGASLVEGIRGDYFNVVGFPVRNFAVELNRLLESMFSNQT
jgi:septum formation protein